MNDSILNQQNILLQNRERIFLEMKKYPNVVHVGVGIKETNSKLTQVLCYRVYVSEKKPTALLKENEKIPACVEGFITDVLSYGEVEEIKTDTLEEIDKPIRPLKGGIRIKSDLYEDTKSNLTRGTGTLGCLVIMDDGSEKIVGLTNAHVVSYNSEDVSPEMSDREVAQPRKVICCCCCVKNIVGKVLDSEKDDRRDCAIIELHDDIINEIKNHGTINVIHEIGTIAGKAIAVADPDNNMLVKKRGAGTGLTYGKVVDVAFGNNQILITAVGDDDRFADFGDSGSVVVDEGNRVVGLLWGIRRARRFRPSGEMLVITDTMTLNDFPRVYGVATPIALVEQRMNIKIPVTPPVVPTFSVHPSDTKTHEIPSTFPPERKPKKHFVTVHGEGGNIILQVTFDQPVDGNRVKWTSSNPNIDIFFPAVGSDRLTATISRNAGQGRGIMTTIGVIVDGFSVGSAADVWIVWTSVFPQNNDNAKVDILMGSTFVTKVFAVRYEIQPKEIISADMDNNDLPDLRGTNETRPPNVSDTDVDVFNKGVDLGGGASLKWDGSAQVRCKGSHPNTVGGFLDSRPNYPSNPLVGNFDTSDITLLANPYIHSDPTLIGSMYCDKVVSFEMPRTLGFINSTGGSRIQLQQFARLELAGHWYIISRPTLSRIHIQLIKKSEILDNKDYDSDGTLAGDDWILLKIETNLDNDDF